MRFFYVYCICSYFRLLKQYLTTMFNCQTISNHHIWWLNHVKPPVNIMAKKGLNSTKSTDHTCSDSPRFDG